jgi:thiol-disulfide isomerase/thioredoxin
VGFALSAARALAAVAICAWASATAVAQAEIKSWSGKVTPRLARADLDGRKVDLRDFRGRVVVVNFWATWCYPCKEELPSLQRLRSKLAGRRFEVLTVNFGEFPQKITQYLERENISLPVLLDTQKDAARDWKVGGLPMTFLVDAKGRVRYWVFGERDWSEGESLKLVEKLLAESPGA